MRKEIIRATPSWRSGPARYDTVYVTTGDAPGGFCGLHVARVKLFFSFRHAGSDFSCALVHWFKAVGNRPDADTGMWIIEPQMRDDRQRRGRGDGRNVAGGRTAALEIISVDAILRAAHLIPIFGTGFTPASVNYSNSLAEFAYLLIHVHSLLDPCHLRHPLLQLRLRLRLLLCLFLVVGLHLGTRASFGNPLHEDFTRVSRLVLTPSTHPRPPDIFLSVVRIRRLSRHRRR